MTLRNLSLGDRRPTARLAAILTSALAAGLLGPAPAKAQAPALGPEFQVNTYTTGHQSYPAVAAVGSDHFVVAWDSVGQDGDQLGVFARLYDHDGAALTAELPVNAYTTGSERLPAVAATTGGGFVVVWQQENGQDGSGSGIFGQLFDGAGTPDGSQFPVNAFTTSVQEEPRVAADGSGNFVVVWQSFSEDANGFAIVARRFDANGSPLSGDIVVNQYTSGNQMHPDVAMRSSGEFVVVWESPGQDGDMEGIFARRFDAAGSPVSSEIPVNAWTTGRQQAPSVALIGSGEFAVVWQSQQDGDGNSIRGRAFDAANVPIVDELAINTFTTGDQEAPRIAVSNDGDILIAWESVGQEGGGSGDRGVFARRFGGDGPPGQEFPLNVHTAANQSRAALAFAPDGQFLAAWQSIAQDSGTSFGIFARRGGFPEARALSVDERASTGSSNVNGVLEVGETVAIDPTWRNASMSSLPLEGAAGLLGLNLPVYTILDSTADYGTIAPDAETSCLDATADCYEMRIDGGPRPAAHWDATFEEQLSEGVGKTWTLHVGESFADVPTSNIFYAFVENIFHNGVTAGGACGGYCPASATLRKQMAVFVLKALEGPFYVPPPATGVFNDVPVNDPFAPWIEELYHRGAVAGCAAPGGPNYCPDDPVLRQQMAVFLLRTVEDPGYVPPGCTGTFADVTCPSLFADWIEEIAARGVAAGCGGGNYCPTNPTTRGQMAPFLVKTFRLALYGP